MRNRLSPRGGVQGRCGGVTPKNNLTLRNLHNQHGGDVVAGVPRANLPREATLRQSNSNHKVLRRGSDTLNVFGPRAPRRVCCTRRLSRGVASSVEGLSLRRTRYSGRRAPCPSGGPRRELARGARAVLAGGGAGERDRRGARRRRGTRRGIGEIKTEIGVASIGDWDNISFGDNWSDDGNVTERLHH